MDSVSLAPQILKPERNARAEDADKARPADAGAGSRSESGSPRASERASESDATGKSRAAVIEAPTSALRIAHPAAKPDHSFATVMASTTVSILAAFAIGRSGWFTPGDDIGYYIGLVGGVLMLLLLLYPLRKHVPAMRNWGKVKHWFAVHMVLGISGPILVLAHSTFHMRSTNAAVALICMLVVAGSGIAGRYLYTKVHRGLYGEKMNLRELASQTGVESAEIRSRLHFAPGVEKRMSEFQAFALEKRNGLGETLRFLSIGMRRWQSYHACVRELKLALRANAQARGWDAPKYRRRLRAASGLVSAFLGATQRVATFSIYDRLLQLWHVAHVPLVYLLVISAIAHVVAVHMY